MKKALILFAAAFLVFGFTSWASASFTNPYTVDPTSAQFYVIDNLGTGSGDGKVTLSNFNSAPGYTLQYSLGSMRTEITPFSNFTVEGMEQRQLVQFRLYPSTGDSITEATMTFGGQYANNSHLYNSVQLLFSGGSGLLAPETPGGTDHVSPVSRHSAVWFFGAGLLGLVGVRRRRRD